MPFMFASKIEPLNLDKYLGKVANRISLVGVELEGAWVLKNIPGGKRPESDGSVFKKSRQLDPYFVQSKGCDCCGEITSRPMLPIGAASWIRKYYPVFCDKTCGLHLHWSFEDMRLYKMLMVPEFPVTVLEYTKRWADRENLSQSHTLWERLSDQSEFCQHKFWPDEQVKLETLKSHEYYDKERKGSRYTVVNYCFKLHGTMECRLLPMFEDVDLSVRAIRMLIDVTNASLVALSKREEKTKLRLSSPSDEIDEYFDIVV